MFWKTDEAYSCEKTYRINDFVAVIIPPRSAYNDAETWGIQVYDEADEEAMEYGDHTAEASGLPSEMAARWVGEAMVDALNAQRNA